jgi:hypothetical protein
VKEERYPKEFLWLLLLILPPLVLGPMLSLLVYVVVMTIGGLIWGIWFNIRQNRKRRQQEHRDEG